LTVTTTRLPVVASRPASCRLPEPAAQEEQPVVGVVTFTSRQSSSPMTGFGAQSSRTPVRRAGGCGARQRFGPVGGAAYGTPSNTSPHLSLPKGSVVQMHHNRPL
jgi:hypothetical protein